MVYLGIAVILALGVGAYFLFRDTMNRIQYVEHLRIYWITKNTARKGVPFLAPSFMRQTQPPFWTGTGVEVRLFKWTFQFGILQAKGSNPIELKALPEVTIKELREWGRPE